MAVWIAAAAMFFAYAGAVPVYFVFCIRIGDSLRTGAGVSLFSPSFAVRAANRGTLDSVRGAVRAKKARKEKSGFGFDALPPARKALIELLKHTRLDSVSMAGSLCMRSAAETAMLCGLANAVRDSAAAIAPGRIRIRLNPVFASGETEIQLRGIFSIPAGHIIRVLIRHMKELFELWKSTRSKA